jgi:hypothetical protein
VKKATRMTAEERALRCRSVITLALAAMRDDDPADANQLLAHAVHDGVQPCELVAEAITQSGGKL